MTPWFALTFGKTDVEETLRLARRAEKLGFDAVYYGMDDFTGRNLECSTMQAAVAVTTDRVRVGSMMGFVQHRPPVLLTEVAVTLDLLSEGRYDLRVAPIATDWVESWSRHGVDLPNGQERVGQLDEALTLYRELCTATEPVSFEGDYYRVKAATLTRQPIQQPHPPITIPGRGPRMLRLVAKHANVWISSEYYVDRSDVLERRERLSQLCERFGRSIDDIAVHEELVVILRTDRDEAENVAREVQGLDAAAINRTDYAIGTPDDCLDKIHQLIGFGVDGFEVWIPERDPTESLELFGREVLPAAREI